MSSTDIFYQAVRNSLMKEGWQITADALRVQLPGDERYDDPAAAHTLAAQRGGRQIVVTIAPFTGPSLQYDYYGAMGRFLCYRLVLEKRRSDQALYLALPLDAYQEFFQRSSIQFVCKEEGLKLIVFSVEREEVVEWIS
jgi:hypothetical protein